MSKIEVRGRGIRARSATPLLSSGWKKSKSHIVTSQSVTVASGDSSLDLETEEGRLTFYQNTLYQAIHGIRQKTLRRLLCMERLLVYELEENRGALYAAYMEDDTYRPSISNVLAWLNPDRLNLLRRSGQDLGLSDHELDYLFNISKRTAQDYLKALYMLHLWD